MIDEFARSEIPIDPPLSDIQLLVLFHSAASVKWTVGRTLTIYCARMVQ